jgi:hypothetical protein
MISYLEGMGDLFIPIALEFIFKLADEAIDGTSLNDDQRSGVKLCYVALDEFGQKYAGRTDTKVDDQLVAKAMAWCEDTAQEGGFELR